MPALSLRPRGEGERMVPFGGAAPVRVAGLLAGAGVPRLARAAWPILALADPDGIETVLWLVGARRSAIAPITGETRCVLRVEARLRDPRATKEATP